MNKLSSRQRRLLAEAIGEDPLDAELDADLAAEPEVPLDRPELAGGAEKPPKPEAVEFSDADKMRESMRAFHKLHAAKQFLSQAANVLGNNQVSVGLGEYANQITGLLSGPNRALEAALIKLSGTLMQMSAKRGAEALAVYNYYDEIPQGSAAGEKLGDPTPEGARAPMGAQAPDQEMPDDVGARPAAEVPEVPMASIERGLGLVENAIEEIGLTENEKTILYGAINQLLDEATTTTGSIAMPMTTQVLDKKDRDILMGRKRKKWEDQQDDKVSWYGEYL